MKLNIEPVSKKIDKSVPPIKKVVPLHQISINNDLNNLNMWFLKYLFTEEGMNVMCCWPPFYTDLNPIKKRVG